jgi:hypothetical protein
MPDANRKLALAVLEVNAVRYRERHRGPIWRKQGRRLGWARDAETHELRVDKGLRRQVELGRRAERDLLRGFVLAQQRKLVPELAVLRDIRVRPAPLTWTRGARVRFGRAHVSVLSLLAGHDVPLVDDLRDTPVEPVRVLLVAFAP